MEQQNIVLDTSYNAKPVVVLIVFIKVKNKIKIIESSMFLLDFL